MAASKITTPATSALSQPLRPELLAVVPVQKLPASIPADCGLTLEDLRTWERLPAKFVRTSPQELRAMEKG